MTNVAYKITDSDGYTRWGQDGETLWAPGRTVSPTGVGTRPCGPGVLHAYLSPEVAALGDPIHARLLPWGRCFRVETVGSGRRETDGLKQWTTSPLIVIDEVAVPALTLLERVAWAIVIAPHPCTREWASNWLADRDRSWEAAASAVRAASAAEAAWAAEGRVVEAAWVAAAWAAAYAAARAAEAKTMEARAAAKEAAEAVWASAVASAEAAVWAARAAGAAGAESRLIPSLARARAVLAGELPAERYDD